MNNSTKTKQISLSNLGKTIFAVGVSASALSLNFAPKANAAAIIDNGKIQLGVDDFGQLNIPGTVPSAVNGTTAVGLRYLPTGNESTSHGCLCEGWGVADAATGVTGYANNSRGTAGITGVSFTSTASTATSIVDILGSTGQPSFEVTHDFAPSAATDLLYSVLVTIKNTSTTDAADLRYRRVFDWDVEPTRYNEYSTIGGTAGASAVLFASDDGFANSNPLAGPTSILATGDFTNSGPTDHGALFDFGFGPLSAGASKTFKIFYGGANTGAEALAALGAVGAEVYSLGNASTDLNGVGGPGLNTFAFGFAGVGGTALPNPTSVPEPFTIVGSIVGGSAALRMRKKLKDANKA